MWASSHYRVAIFSHHGPPKSFLSESQGPLLSLVTRVLMHTVQCHVELTHRNNKGKDSLCLTLWGCAHVHETLIQDETIVDTEEHLALFCLSLHSKTLLEKGIPLWKRCVPPEMKPLATCGQGGICLLGFCPVYNVHGCKLCCLHPHFPAQMLMLLQEFLARSDLTRSAAPTIAPSRRDWMISQLWLMETQLNASVVPLSAPF